MLIFISIVNLKASSIILGINNSYLIPLFKCFVKSNKESLEEQNLFISFLKSQKISEDHTEEISEQLSEINAEIK